LPIDYLPFNQAKALTLIELFFALGLCGTDEESKSTSFRSKGRRREFFWLLFLRKKK